MQEGSIEVPVAAASRLRSLYATAQQVQQVCDVSMAMLKDALGVPVEWLLIELEGRMMFTSVSAVAENPNDVSEAIGLE